jgi:hypothetical protein
MTPYNMACPDYGRPVEFSYHKCLNDEDMTEKQRKFRIPYYEEVHGVGVLLSIGSNSRVQIEDEDGYIVDVGAHGVKFLDKRIEDAGKE